MGAPLLSVEALTMRFGGLIAVDALSFEARAVSPVACIHSLAFSIAIRSARPCPPRPNTAKSPLITFGIR